jgi:hypothetical protein
MQKNNANEASTKQRKVKEKKREKEREKEREREREREKEMRDGGEGRGRVHNQLTHEIEPTTRERVHMVESLRGLQIVEILLAPKLVDKMGQSSNPMFVISPSQLRKGGDRS